MIPNRESESAPESAEAAEPVPASETADYEGLPGMDIPDFLKR